MNALDCQVAQSLYLLKAIGTPDSGKFIDYVQFYDFTFQYAEVIVVLTND